MNLDLFNTPPEPWTEPLSPGAMMLRQYAAAHTDSLLAGIHAIAAQRAGSPTAKLIATAPPTR